MEKPIFFNTEMVEAILKGRKISTRRLIKNVSNIHQIVDKNSGYFKFAEVENENTYLNIQWAKPLYKVNDILYVRETWLAHSRGLNTLAFKYKADGAVNDCVSFAKERFNKFYKFADKEKWQPSLFMPKEAARIFLKVTDVKVERLQQITEEGAKEEGAIKQIWYQPYGTKNESNQEYVGDLAHHKANYITGFADIWDRTLNKSHGWLYSFDVSPWVWVIKFKRI